MERSATSHLVRLIAAVPGRRTLRIPRPRGHRVAARSGEIWVTQEHRLGDIVLRPGESVELEGNGLALVTALASADVEVIPPAQTPALAARLDGVDIAAYERRARRMRAEAITGFVAAGWRRLRERLA
ncbi:MAG: DUF2917 domain-containing protein [Burkholderiales bacterium]|nr:DUF2917 domain-containing protein [Burkholderiales bacterium]